MSIRSLRNATEWALMVTLLFGAGAMAQAQDKQGKDIQEEGVVQIGRADKDEARPNLPPRGDEDRRRPEAPKYWIGLLGGTIQPDNPLRAHLDFPANQGLLVANVVPDSPAAKAGLKQHDILLKANNTELHEMTDLVDLVKSEGDKKGQITLEIMRHAKRETVYLKPEERPANAPSPQGGEFRGPGGFGGEFRGPGMGPGLGEMPEDLLEQFRDRIPFEFRNFGPGVIVGGGQGVANLPNGVSISIQKQNDKPAQITVKRGDETWNVVGDDPESLKKLPAELRPFVEQMLQGGGRMHFNLPREPQGIGPRAEDSGRLRDRLERMEKRLEEMQKRLHGPGNPPADEAPDQAPRAK